MNILYQLMPFYGETVITITIGGVSYPILVPQPDFDGLMFAVSSAISKAFKQ